MKNHRGTIETKFFHIIPFILYISYTKVTNGKDTDNIKFYKIKNKVFALYLTPFFSIALTLPHFLLKKY